MKEEILNRYFEENLLIADGFDDAIIGIEQDTMRIIYSVKKCINILEKEMSFEDATEYFYINVNDSYVGKQTPIWCVDNM
tara:strand:+ start:23770 stop:24009 length:240 start_codon:yes stop_codon:yes gene_type:complete